MVVGPHLIIWKRVLRIVGWACPDPVKGFVRNFQKTGHT